MNLEVFLVWRKTDSNYLKEPFRVVDSVFLNEEEAKTQVLQLIKLPNTIDCYYEKREVK